MRCYLGWLCLDAVQVTRATFIRVSKNRPSSPSPLHCPLAATMSTLSTGQTQTHNMLEIEYFQCLLHSHFLSGEGEDTTHIVWVCGQFMA